MYANDLFSRTMIIRREWGKKIVLAGIVRIKTRTWENIIIDDEIFRMVFFIFFFVHTSFVLCTIVVC